MEENTYSLTFQSRDLATLSLALSNLPYRDVAGLIERIQAQLQTQNQERETPPSDAPTT